MSAPATRRPATAPYARYFADRYDTWFGKPSVTADTVAFLARLAESGTALELGVGTGRIALPLSRRGVWVEGIDASPEMAAQLAAKPGGDRIPVTIADLTRPPLNRRPYDVVYLVAGTLFELDTQDDQLRCFQAATQLTDPNGVFVLDAIVPEVLVTAEESDGQIIPTTNDDTVVLRRSFDRAAQRYQSHYRITPGDGSSAVDIDVSFRYAGTGELDLMARQAGLELRERYGSWSGAPFTDGCAYHVSVYRHPR
ncbi:class I SAM-dependent DNA methyltransferase [Kitasatospora griseola]|uniref:class I SAM-dependent DNA methyltransferase n=1 Tax=Kitasatospora griseola TaxID=2064 RepID=UPI0005C4F8C7|nr:class I SAM-dependent methyltransferase [Kitasatospora griseola]